MLRSVLHRATAESLVDPVFPSVRRLPTLLCWSCKKYNGRSCSIYNGCRRARTASSEQAGGIPRVERTISTSGGKVNLPATLAADLRNRYGPARYPRQRIVGGRCASRKGKTHSADRADRCTGKLSVWGTAAAIYPI